MFKEKIEQKNIGYEKEISDLIFFCFEKKLELKDKLIEILLNHRYKEIIKGVTSQLINKNDKNLIEWILEYLSNDIILLLEIINLNKDIMIGYFKKERKIEFKNSFNQKDNMKILQQLNNLRTNELLPYINFKPLNFKSVISDKEILSFVIMYINKEKEEEDWNILIRDIINKLIKDKQLKKFNDLLQMINLEENIDIKQKYFTIDVLDGINLDFLTEDDYFNEFKKTKLIEILAPNSEEFSDKISSLIGKKKFESLHQNIKAIIKQIILIYKDDNIESITTFIYSLFKNIKSNCIKDIIEEIKNNIENKELVKIFLHLEKKPEPDLPTYKLILDYLFDGENIDDIKDLVKNCNEKNEILSRINSKLIIKEEKLEKIIPLIEKDEANYRLLNEIKNYIKDSKSEIEYVQQSNNILEKLKKQISDVNLWNFKILKTYINNKKLIDFLGFQENEKQEIQKSIKKYESCYTNLIFIIISFLILFLVNIIYNQLNKNNNDILYEINWNIFNKSKELVQYENDKYPFEEVLNTKLSNEEIYRDNKTEIPGDLLIIGLDLGSINTGYSYTIKSNNDIDQNQKIINIGKSPNEIEISRDGKNGLKYAYKASVSLSNYRIEELEKINFIKGIKNLMYMEKYNDDNLCYFYPNDCILNMNITYVIKEYLLMIKNDIIKKLKDEKINTKKIKWIISVPQSWNEFEKQIIINSAIESGLSDISLIYESEAASLSIFTDKNIDNDFTKRKKNFILIDIGGINTQISIYEINKDFINEKIQIQNNTIQNTGFLIIVEKIINVLENTLGKNNINKIKKEEPGNWLKMLKNIYKAIENTYRINGIEVFDIYIPFSFKGEYEYKYETDKGIKKYKIKYGSFNLIFPGGLIANFILESINKIIDNINKILDEMKTKRIPIYNIIIAGGFSKNQIIQTEIKNNFIENEYIHIHYLSSYENVISKGGVYYGLNNSKINSRFSRETIGIKIGNKINSILEKGKNMKNDFNKIILIKPSLKQQDIIQINIYTSKKNNVVNENDFVGRLLIYLNGYSDIIKVKINYGVVLSFEAYKLNNLEKIITKFEYFK